MASARRYLYGGLAWGTAAQLTVLLALWWLWRNGAAARLYARGRQSPWRATAAVAGLTALVVYGVSLPWDFYLDFIRERAYGFTHISAGAWALQWLGEVGVEFALALGIVELLYAGLRRWRRPRWYGAYTMGCCGPCGGDDR